MSRIDIIGWVANAGTVFVLVIPSNYYSRVTSCLLHIIIIGMETFGSSLWAGIPGMEHEARHLHPFNCC